MPQLLNDSHCHMRHGGKRWNRTISSHQTSLKVVGLPLPQRFISRSPPGSTGVSPAHACDEPGTNVKSVHLHLPFTRLGRVPCPTPALTGKDVTRRLNSKNHPLFAFRFRLGLAGSTSFGTSVAASFDFHSPHQCVGCVVGVDHPSAE